MRWVFWSSKRLDPQQRRSSSRLRAQASRRGCLFWGGADRRRFVMASPTPAAGKAAGPLSPSTSSKSDGLQRAGSSGLSRTASGREGSTSGGLGAVDAVVHLKAHKSSSMGQKKPKSRFDVGPSIQQLAAIKNNEDSMKRFDKKLEQLKQASFCISTSDPQIIVSLCFKKCTESLRPLTRLRRPPAEPVAGSELRGAEPGSARGEENRRHALTVVCIPTTAAPAVA